MFMLEFFSESYNFHALHHGLQLFIHQTKYNKLETYFSVRTDGLKGYNNSFGEEMSIHMTFTLPYKT